MPSFYDSISKKWDATRQNSWGEFEFAKSFLISNKILDAGCGNGRLNFWLKKNNFQGDYFGFDSSKNLIALAKKNFPDKKFATQDLLSFQKSNSADAIFCVAVLHHLSKKEDQQKAIGNLFQNLQPGGRIFLTSWNLWQPRFWKYFFQDPHFREGKFSRNLKIPFGGEGSREVFVFRKSDLKKLFKQAGFKNIKIFYARHSLKSNFLRGRNLIVLAEK
jgi:SAM-dependent methyltransferase